jgi:hypothetical protein
MANKYWLDKGTTDSDKDGLSDDFESYVLGTDPKLYDTDGDGLNDFRERDFGSDPRKRDSDGDDVDDYREVIVGTDPRSRDTDGDTIDDRTELRAGTAFAPDADGDGTPDWHEPRDSDRDLLGDAEERWLRTNPQDEDSDQDGQSDLLELVNGSHPRIDEGSFGVPFGPGSGGVQPPPPTIFDPDASACQPAEPEPPVHDDAGFEDAGYGELAGEANFSTFA